MGSGEEVKSGTYEFATVGIKHLKIWSATGLELAKSTFWFDFCRPFFLEPQPVVFCRKGKVTSRIPGTMEKTKVVVKAYPCACYDRKSELLVGTDYGAVYGFKGSELQKFFKAGAKRVGAISVTDNGIAVATDEDMVHLYDENDGLLSSIDLTSLGGANPDR